MREYVKGESKEARNKRQLADINRRLSEDKKNAKHKKCESCGLKYKSNRHQCRHTSKNR